MFPFIIWYFFRSNTGKPGPHSALHVLGEKLDFRILVYSAFSNLKVFAFILQKCMLAKALLDVHPRSFRSKSLSQFLLLVNGLEYSILAEHVAAINDHTSFIWNRLIIKF